jgi:hypothetical protein
MTVQKYLWIVERKIGNWSAWVGKISRRGTKGPMPNEQGKMTFGKGDYAVDPNKYRVLKIPKGIHPGDVVKVQLWGEDDSTPKDFFLPGKEVGNEFTASLLHNISKIKRLELSRTNKETDKIVTILAIALIIAMIGMTIIGYYAMVKK